jgi:Raf kinase inhibitor-like YbhB/YbcL family protein
MAGAIEAAARDHAWKRRLATVSMLAGLTVILVACGPAGTPSPPATETSMPSDFRLTSSAFEPGGVIPALHTCDGENVSPDLAWAGAPNDTQAFVLVVDDPDADGFVHWILYDLTGSDSGALPSAVSASPDAPQQGTNDFGEIGWSGPCPPSGEHRYRFRLHALREPLELMVAPDPAGIREALDGADVLAVAELEGRYQRGG